ncbi:hypothetical protein [Sphingomonas sp. S2M10]|uniref:hypothetical protein n=1 Tax=Sphingomonas sp. S2M10 TaxID=2705010 RepID=UPI0014574AFB|nr:hypothetical protein [Sphingomonas sp. S2M10]
MRILTALTSTMIAASAPPAAAAPIANSPDPPCRTSDVTCGYDRDPASLPLMQGPEDMPARPATWPYWAGGGLIVAGLLLTVAWARRRR